ncbi:cyclin-like protein [Punctularia strigosozonata HHB-11173 SS5]|uniref:cyclin-like protein n=1 Tax=Punctularia strigosozonata (strain HHB-11173) TaxID=741275 RepID=UPI0004417BA3|nr:cyclin-like protein [Punctularia strigosozonata HHB-11173 SS5]EIN13489.1 cyclin-like protein [Punctularia strigosozonata HHB-11173 SS5]
MAVETTALPSSSAVPAAPTKPLYEASTQYNHWRFSPEQLAHTRETLNAAAVAAIKDTFEADSASLCELTRRHGRQPGSSADIAFLAAGEEQLLVKLYISKIPQLCGHFRFPEEVEATAVSYLKRFYLKNTVMDWHPKNVMLTALFLATKTTNHPISIEAFTTAIPRTAPSDVLDLEFLVSQSLNFEFAVHHAHRALWGLWLDVQSLPDVPQAITRDTYEAALTHARAARLTDAELIYTPSQIALACLHLVAPETAAQWARSKGSEAVLGILGAIGQMIRRDGTVPQTDNTMREIDRRLKICKNPEKVVGSKAYIAKQERAARKAEAKRVRKAQAIQKAVDEGDPFGNELAGSQAGVDPDDDDDDDDE